MCRTVQNRAETSDRGTAIKFSVGWLFIPYLRMRMTGSQRERSLASGHRTINIGQFGTFVHQTRQRVLMGNEVLNLGGTPLVLATGTAIIQIPAY